MRSSRLAEPVIRRPGLVLAVILVVTALAVIPALRFRVDTDLAALLPDGAPAADDYRLFLRTFGGFEKVFIVVRSEQPLEDPSLLIDAADVLAGEMGRSPEVAEARSGITEEDERFFLRFIAPRMSIGTSVLWYDASNLRVGPNQTCHNLGVCDDGSGRPGRGGDWLDVMLNWRYTF